MSEPRVASKALALLAKDTGRVTDLERVDVAADVPLIAELVLVSSWKSDRIRNGSFRRLAARAVSDETELFGDGLS